MERVLAEMNPYLALYLITLAVHMALVSFPLGGSVLLCLFEIFRGEEITVLRELISRHLALSIGLAITAGVAPLLFIEIVHPHAFYNAGAILGGWRPFLLVPLTIGFYLAYLQKTETFRRWPGLARLPVRMAGLASIGAVGSIWIISRRVGEVSQLWRSRYAELPLEKLIWDSLPLLGLVFAAAILGCTIGTLWLLGREEKAGRLSPGERFLAEETLLRLAIFVAIGLTVVQEILRERQDRAVDLDWWILRSAMFVMIVGFGVRLHRVGPGRLIATVGAASGLGIVLLMREEQRWTKLRDQFDLGTVEVASSRGGLIAFILSAVVAATGILLAFRRISRAPAPEPTEDTTVEDEP